MNPMDNQDGLAENPLRLVTSKNRAIQKCFGTLPEYRNLKLAQQRGLQLYQTRSNAVIPYDTLPADFIEKAIFMRLYISFIKGKACSENRVLFSQFIRNVVHKIYRYQKQDYLGNRNKMRRATGKPEATLPTAGYLVIDLNGETAGCAATK